MKRHDAVTLSVRLVALLSLMLSVACQRDPVSPGSNGLDANQPASDKSQVDKNAQEPTTWSTMSDAALWNTITATDTVLVVGLKSVGTARGVAKGRATVGQAEWRGSAKRFLSESGIRVLSIDSTHLPVVSLIPRDATAIGKIRRLPFVDYVEPRQLPIQFASDGCESGGSGDSQYNDLMLTLPSGDRVSREYTSDRMNVLNAWKLSTGQGVTIGVTDTGLNTAFGSEFDVFNFAAGQSSGRSLVVQQFVPPSCSHGTRIAGLAAGPMNGLQTAGVGYRSNLVSYHQANGVTPNEFSAADAIHYAAINGSKVIVMAWGMLTGSSAVSDEIDAHYYQNDVMFVGAAGTCPIGLSCPRIESAVFPSSKEEVLAVTGANHNGSRPDVYDYGTKSGVLAFTNLATVGIIPGILNIGGSSAATGFVGGAAALVRSRSPGLTARQTMDKIIQTSGSICGGGGVNAWRNAMINVSAAVGGPCVGAMSGQATHYINDPFNPLNFPVEYVVLTARSFTNFTPGGSGSYAVTWFNRPEQILTFTEQSEINQNGNTFLKARRSMYFAPAGDGQPYRTFVQMQVVDTQLNTNDLRQISVLVCSSVSVCYDTTRSYPGP